MFRLGFWLVGDGVDEVRESRHPPPRVAARPTGSGWSWDLASGGIQSSHCSTTSLSCCHRDCPGSGPARPFRRRCYRRRRHPYRCPKVCDRTAQPAPVSDHYRSRIERTRGYFRGHVIAGQIHDRSRVGDPVQHVEQVGGGVQSQAPWAAQDRLSACPTMYPLDSVSENREGAGNHDLISKQIGRALPPSGLTYQHGMGPRVAGVSNSWKRGAHNYEDFAGAGIARVRGCIPAFARTA
jgi:hypothetical protein